jgi:phenylalanyl-tRNA synthetase alpha chain
MITERVKELVSEIEQAAVSNKEQLEAFRLKYISKKGAVTELFDNLKNIPQEDRRAVGQELNTLKNLAQTRFQDFQSALENSADSNPEMLIDLTCREASIR